MYRAPRLYWSFYSMKWLLMSFSKDTGMYLCAKNWGTSAAISITNSQQLLISDHYSLPIMCFWFSDKGQIPGLQICSYWAFFFLETTTLTWTWPDHVLGFVPHLYVPPESPKWIKVNANVVSTIQMLCSVKSLLCAMRLRPASHSWELCFPNWFQLLT